MFGKYYQTVHESKHNKYMDCESCEVMTCITIQIKNLLNTCGCLFLYMQFWHILEGWSICHDYKAIINAVVTKNQSHYKNAKYVFDMLDLVICAN